MTYFSSMIGTNVVEKEASNEMRLMYLLQPDGTWTDIPRCIEHEPGKESQVPGRCPGIPGYCSDDLPGGVCEFDCLFGPDIRSFCTPDGTWDPYPFCEGDIRYVFKVTLLFKNKTRYWCHYIFRCEK